MPDYAYKAQTMSGSLIKGRMEAADEFSIMQYLKEKGYFPVEIKEVRPSKDIQIKLFSKISLKDIAIFCRQFATIIGAGLTIINGLDILRQQIENKKLRTIINEVFESVQKGRTLSESLRAYDDFPPLFTNMIAAGEASGRLEEMLDRTSGYYEKESKLRQKIKSALTYPAVVSVVAIAVVIFLVTKVLPMFVDMFDEMKATLPLPTRILLGISYGMRKYWFIILIVFILAVYLTSRYIRTKEGRYNYHKLLFRLPVIGKVYKKVVTARFARILSTLLTSGLPVLQALDILQTTITNAVIEQGIEKCKEDIRKGIGLSRSLANMDVFPPMLIHMASVGEETGTLDAILSKTSQFYEDDVDIAVAGLTSLIEPVIVVFLAAIVGFIIVSIILPMFDMYSNMV